MSLINEALKKAQRARNEGQPTDAPPIPGGGPVARREQPRSAKTIVLIGGGALALVIVSVVVTVYLLNRPSAPATSAVTVASTREGAANPSSSPAPKSGAPVTPAPVIAPTTSKSPDAITPSPAPADKSRPIATAPTKASPTPTSTPAPDAPKAPAISTSPTSTAAVSPAAPAAVSSAPASSPAPAPAAKPDERVAAFVESLRVTGIRSSGNDSRVLMNEKVYRVNELVDRTLGVRLVKVGTDSLTFADANGATYVKYF
jgi:hypothetical protein